LIMTRRKLQHLPRTAATLLLLTCVYVLGGFLGM
jgi:hypothetical protein